MGAMLHSLRWFLTCPRGFVGFEGGLAEAFRPVRGRLSNQPFDGSKRGARTVLAGVWSGMKQPTPWVSLFCRLGGHWPAPAGWTWVRAAGLGEALRQRL